MKVIGGIQHRFMTGKSCFINVIAFYKEVTGLVDRGAAVDFVYIVFSKAFDTVSYNILIDKLKSTLDKWIVRLVKN